MKKAFTLIELLVVVLIIGILSAIALPQYQKAVEKAEAVQAFILLKTVVQAEEDYYLANGTYTTYFNDLSIDIPFTGTAKFINYDTQDISRSNNDWILQIEHWTTEFNAFIVRKNGKYKGAGFYVNFASATNAPSKQISCFERKKGANYNFDSSLSPGAFCQQIANGTLFVEDEWGRYYTLP